MASLVNWLIGRPIYGIIVFMNKLMIVAGEASGELYGAGLVKVLKEKIPELRVFGMGGEMMEASGVEIVAGIKGVSVVGITEVISHLRTIRRVFKSLTKRMAEERPDAVVLIDFPDFNLRLAKMAKGERIPVVYYISPQVWAWRPKRVKRIARLVDKMLVAFPFEVDIYKKAGVDSVFVGHPILDGITESKRGDIKGYNLDPERPVIALLPGSRKREIEVHLPIMLKTLDILKPDVQAIIPVAPSVDFPMVSKMVRGKDITLTKGDVWEVLSIADAAIITSGTATLQAAIKGVPMVIIYKVSPPTYLLGKILVKTKNIGIVNIISGREIVPELIQSDARPEGIADIIKRILDDPSYRDGMKRDLLDVKEKLGGPGASDRAAQEIIRFILR